MASPAPVQPDVAQIKTEDNSPPSARSKGAKATPRGKTKDSGSGGKRKCVSTACIACRRRKSKCDGNTPSCAACSSVYGTECVYDPNSDHRRKGVYKKGVDSSKTHDSTLKVLIEGILNYPEHEVMQLVKQIRSCESLEEVAEAVNARNARMEDHTDVKISVDSAADDSHPQFERELAGNLGELKLQNGTRQFLGGTSVLLFDEEYSDGDSSEDDGSTYATQEEAVRSWTTVTADAGVILHLLNVYFCWHYSYFTTLSRALFFRDFWNGRPLHQSRADTNYCSPLLVNAMLSLGCHFTSWPSARADPSDPSTAGDHFHSECKRLMVTDGYEIPRLTTVQALVLMSMREAGCAREAKGWFYSGMSFRMAMDMGLHHETSVSNLPEEEADACRMTFWGCYLFDKVWSNYLGRQPQLSLDNITLKKFDVFPFEDSQTWAPWTEEGPGQTHSQPARTRAAALHLSALCEISSDLLRAFYRLKNLEQPLSKQAEVQKLSDLQIRLESWRNSLPKEFEAREGQLPQVLLMHMLFNLLFIHLFRPFLKYSQGNSPLPSHVSPKKQCTQAAAAISKYLRMYKKTYGLRRICNISVYITHTACTIHLLNLPDRNAQRDLVHGLTHLEEISEVWLCSRRTLSIIAQQVEKWKIILPEEASKVLARADGAYRLTKMRQRDRSRATSSSSDPFAHQQGQNGTVSPNAAGRFDLDIPPVNGLPPNRNSGRTASQTARDRSSSSTYRNGNQRSLQQSSLPLQFKGQDYQMPTPSESKRKIDSNLWPESAVPTNPISTPNDPSITAKHGSLHVPPKREPPQTSQTSSPGQSSVASPTGLFVASHHQETLHEEQKEWWFRDQSSIFDHWMHGDGVSNGNNSSTSNNGNPSSAPIPGVGTGEIEAQDLVNMHLYNGMEGMGYANFASGMGVPAEWESFGVAPEGGQHQGNPNDNSNNYGGFNPGMM